MIILRVQDSDPDLDSDSASHASSEENGYVSDSDSEVNSLFGSDAAINIVSEVWLLIDVDD